MALVLPPEMFTLPEVPRLRGYDFRFEHLPTFLSPAWWLTDLAQSTFRGFRVAFMLICLTAARNHTFSASNAGIPRLHLARRCGDELRAGFATRW